MLRIKGQFNEAIIFNDEADAGAIEQIRELCNQPFTKGSRIRVMPDVHAGAGSTIGTTMTISDKVVPNMVGVDIGCGMEVVRLQETHVNCARLDDVIHTRVPSGRQVRPNPHPFAARINVHNLRCAGHVDLPRAQQSIGTLGGGNHFIELNAGHDGALYLVVHSGSRQMGLQVAGCYQDAAWHALPAAERSTMPKSLAYVTGELMQDYLHDMQLTQRFAVVNRQAIMAEILDGMNLTEVDRFTTIHNYIELETLILRKGAVSAKKGERFLVPMNMRDGSLICIGKGNPEWNFSAPHGAGRLMSRTEAFRRLKLDDFRTTMAGIYTTSVNQHTLDESPFAYKRIESILAYIGDTAEVAETIRPVYNFKAAE